MLFVGSHVFCKLAFHPHNRRKTEGKSTLVKSSLNGHRFSLVNEPSLSTASGSLRHVVLKPFPARPWLPKCPQNEQSSGPKENRRKTEGNFHRKAFCDRGAI